MDDQDSASESLVETLKRADELVKTAKRNNKSLSGDNYYATRFSDAKANSTLLFRSIRGKLSKNEDSIVKEALAEIESTLAAFFNPAETPWSSSRAS